MKVYLVSQPHANWDHIVRFIMDEKATWATDYETDGDLLPELGGRLCYMSFGQGRKTNQEYLANIIAQQHFSVLEHSNFGLIITGVSRSLTHELVRHRHFSFSQLSQRYVDESAVRMVIPPLLQGDSQDPDLQDAGTLWKIATNEALDNYKNLLELLEAHVEQTYPDLPKTDRKKMARQTARSVLPNATETKIMVTGNLRSWREFVQKRNSPAADAEIRELAQLILKELQVAAPNAVQDLT